MAAVGEARARLCWLLACVRAWKRADPRERANGTREWNGLEQAICDGRVSHTQSSRSWEFVVQPGRARGRAATCTDVRWQGLPWASGIYEGRSAACLQLSPLESTSLAVSQSGFKVLTARIGL